MLSQAKKCRGYGKHKIDSREHATCMQHTGSQELTQINATELSEQGQPTCNTLTFVFIVFENINGIHH
jgi:hypothetical protein